jgi:hypothetical protein
MCWLEIRPCYSIIGQLFKMVQVSGSEHSIRGSKHGENVVATINSESPDLIPSQLDAGKQREGRLLEGDNVELNVCTQVDIKKWQCSISIRAGRITEYAGQ